MTLLMIGAPEIICIVLIVLLLFGAKKIPDLMKGLGKGVKMFKQGMNEMEEEVKRPLEEQQLTENQSSEQQPNQDGK